MKVIVLLILGLLMTVVTALISTLFFYAGWNWGLVPAVAFAKPIGLATAFWLSLCLASVGGMLKTSVSTSES